MITTLNEEYLNQVLTNIHKKLLLEEPHLLNLAIVGDAAYGFVQEPKEIKFFGMYVPSLEELCLGKPGSVRSYRLQYQRVYYNITLVSAVTLVEEFCRGNYLYLEMFFSHYNLFVPRYQEFANLYFQKPSLIRDINSSLCLRKLVLTEYYKLILSIPHIKNTKDYFHIMKFFTIAKMIFQGDGISEALHPTNEYIKLYLESTLEADLSALNINEIIVSARQQIQNYMTELAYSTSLTDEINHQLLAGVAAIVKDSLAQTTREVDPIDFLTPTEQRAYSLVLSKLEDGKAILPIGSLVTESGISRDSFKSMFQKLSSMKIITTKNMGVKGTQIILLK